MHRTLGSLFTGVAASAAVPGIDSGTLVLIVAAAVFAVATWRSRAPGLLRQDNAALASRLKNVEHERDDAKVALHKVEGRLEEQITQIAELRAKDTSALYDLMVAHDLRVTEISAKLVDAIDRLVSGQRTLEEAVRIIATGQIASLTERES